MLLALGGGVRLALPYIVKSYVNRQLAHLGEYRGRIGDVDIHLWRGAYRIQDIRIVRIDGGVAIPFFEARVMDLSVEWRELIRGALVTEIEMLDPRLNFVAGPTPETTQNGSGAAWGKALGSLFPFKINRLQLANGRIDFHNLHAVPPVDIFVGELWATATNLTNARDLPQPLPAGIVARGTALGRGALDLHLQLDPLVNPPAFEITAQLTNVNLVALNDFLRAYAKFDVERGTFALFASFASAEGRYEGYTKVFFENLDVFDWEKERKKNALQVFWHAIVGTVSTVFRNQPKDSLATKIPIAGSWENREVDLWTAISTLLRNAFVRALVPKLDQTIQVDELRLKPANADRAP